MRDHWMEFVEKQIEVVSDKNNKSTTEIHLVSCLVQLHLPSLTVTAGGGGG